MTDELRRDMILLMLENLNPDPDLIYTAGTPQYQAAEWLIDQDLFTACPSDPKLIQRYVLAVFYYSTNGDSWDQCSQNDATCGDNAPFFLDRNFLSDSSECEWAGASCDFDGCIIRLEFGKENISVYLTRKILVITSHNISSSTSKNKRVEQHRRHGTIRT